MVKAEEPYRAAADRPIDIRHIRLDLRLDLPAKTVEGRATLQVRSLRPLSAVALDAADFEVKAVTLVREDRETPAHFQHDGQKLSIDLDPAWPAGQEATLHIDYRVRQPRTGLHFFAPSEAEPHVPLMVWSQGEAKDNHYWFPCLDQPNQKQTTELVVTVADGFEVLSNGRLVERRANPDQTVTFHWREEQPHAAYLVTLVVGQFDVVRDEWHKIPLLYYVPKGHKDEVAGTFGHTPEMLDLFSRRFGIAYPWEKYAQVVVEQFTAGGMENTSATTLTERALHDERSLLDSSPDPLLSHELAHQWWGDLLTCRDWTHIWLNEGFASYAEALWDEHHNGNDEYAYTMLKKAQTAIAGGKERPIVDHHWAFPMAMFDARAYPKGAWVLHMLRKQLGEDAFWKGIQRYGREYRLQSVETSDLRETLEKESGRSLERFFHDWTERPGNPVLEVSTEYLPESRLARVSVKQTQQGDPFVVPLTVVFHGPEGNHANPVVLRQEVSEKEQTLYTALPDRPVRIEVDPEQAVLAEIKENKGRELWLAQLQQGATVISRIRAAQHLGQTRQQGDREVLAKALAEEKFWGVQVEIAGALGESGGDTSRDALIQGLSLAEPRVRRACLDQLGKFPRDAVVAAAVKKVLEHGDRSYFVEAAAVAAYAKLQQADTVSVIVPWLEKPSYGEVIRTAVLNGLGDAQNLAALETLVTWTHRGKPRTCRTAALQALGRLAQTANPSDEQRQKIVSAVAACLEEDNPSVLRTAVTVVRDLGRSAAPTVAELEAISRHDPNESLRELARKAVEQIRSNQPAPVEVTRLREELERLRQAQDKLQDRLERFEKVERKGM